jgi:hypothetical protein
MYRPFKFDALQVLHNQQSFSVRAEQIIKPYISCVKVQVKVKANQKEYGALGDVSLIAAIRDRLEALNTFLQPGVL